MAARRVQLKMDRMSGIVTETNGRDGKITPLKPINHIEAQKNGGKLRFTKADCGGKFISKGMKVNFLVYSDGNGLGAQNIKLGGAAAFAGKPNAQQKPGADVKRVVLKMDRVTGIVTETDGMNGKITPLKRINHIEAQKNGGKLRFTKADCGGKFISKGMKVNFLVYSDGNGLGAQNIKTGQNIGTPAAKPNANTPNTSKVASAAAPGTIKKRVVGTVVNWSGFTGLIQPSGPIIGVPADRAKKRGGKIFFTKAYLAPGVNTVIKNAKVNFILTSDPNGMKALNVRMGTNVSAPQVKGVINKFDKAKTFGKFGGSAPQTNNGNLWSAVQKFAPKFFKKVTPGKPAPKSRAFTAVQKTIQKNMGKSGNIGAQPTPPKYAPKKEKPLPPNWEEHWSDVHDTPYYWNKVTKASLWVRPR